MTALDLSDLTPQVNPSIVYGEPPYVPPPPPVDPGRYKLGMEWQGWDGTRWSLNDDEGGIVVLPGIRGLGKVEADAFVNEFAAAPGSYYRGYRAISREVFWPLYLYSDGESQEWIDFDSAFWRTMLFGKWGRWTVTTPNGASRSLELRYEKGGEDDFERDPVFFGWNKYGIYLRADQPYWEGEPVSESWSVDEVNAPQSWFGPGDIGGPPFFLPAPLASEDGTIFNPGDVEAWPTWTVVGPVTSIKLIVGGRELHVPFAVNEGQVLTIDTRPSVQTATLNDGSDLTTSLGSFGFAPIKPGAESVIKMIPVAPAGSTGSVRCEITPLYERAY